MREETSLDVAVIGAGFAGVYLVHKLRDQLGLRVQAFERGDDVGGTWYWNRYPGARCDFESEFYSYSFNDAIQQEWNWSERYAAQPEILAYIQFVADRLDVRRSIHFETAVVAAEFDAERDVWRVRTDRGTSVTARYLVAATGVLSAPATPQFADMDSFRGPIHHTARWPREGVDFTGQRVAVIGTGSSGIQLIPLIAEQADYLTVFQRTATFSVPAANRPLTERERQLTKRSYPVLREAAKQTSTGILLEQPMGEFAGLDPRLVTAELERRWRTTGLGVTATLSDTLVSADANEFIAEFVREKIRQTVTDPRTAALLEPHGHPIATKRLALDTGYYETFNQPHVSLVSVRETPIERFAAAGVVVDGHVHQVDSIVLATGFDAVTGALERIDIRGLGGVSLKEAWAEGPVSYLGLAVRGFPNLFTVTGPGCPAVFTNVVASIEHHVEWIADYLTFLGEAGVTRSDVDADAQAQWVTHVAELAAGTLFPRAASWYMGVNIPGKPRVFLAYVGGFAAYAERCDEVVRNGYAGFVHSGPDAWSETEAPEERAMA
jgi:cyclohexanone monooxygenase